MEYNQVWNQYITPILWIIKIYRYLQSSGKILQKKISFKFILILIIHFMMIIEFMI